MYKCKAVTLEFGPETSSMVSRLLAMFDLNLCSALDYTYSLLPSLIFQGVSESGSSLMLLLIMENRSIFSNKSSRLL